MTTLRITTRGIERAGLAAVLVIAAGLRLWRLDDNGFGTEYYAAGVRSMLQSGHLFFYNAFDPAGFVSLDKPPVAFWIQAAFAAVLGFSAWTLHLPQALAGIGSVAILYALVRKPFGATTGLIAALLLAIAPIAVAVDRSNNTDSWLVFFLLLAATAALRGRGPAFVSAMALLGVAFNVKMLAALVCGPALLAAYLLAAGSSDWRRQLVWLAAGGATLLAIGLSWAAAFDLSPRESRPYAGSSLDNSMLELIVMHNGLERFVRNRPATSVPVPPTAQTPRLQAYDAIPVGPLRLAHPRLAAQFAWLLPLAVCGLALGWRRYRASVALWGLWMATYGIVYSAAGGIFHLYYLVALTPPLAALAAIGGVALWRHGPLALSAALIVSAAWQAWILAGPLGWSTPWMAAPIVAAVFAMAVAVTDRRVALLAASALLLLLPAAWALSPIFAAGNRMLPSASLPRWLGIDDGRGILLSRSFATLTDDPKLRAFLIAQRGDARFIAAAPSTWLASSLIIRTAAPVMAVGGFSGNDPILSLDAFKRKVEQGEVRFVLLSNTPGLRRAGDAVSRQGDFVRWVRANGVPVKEELWRSLPDEPRRSIALYDLAPALRQRP